MRPGLPDHTSADPIERQSSRPNFQGLVYPGRSGDMQPTDGPDHPPGKSFTYSSDPHFNILVSSCRDSPDRFSLLGFFGPAFLCASYNDREDIAEGLAEVYLRYKRAGASAEMHMYATSGHGFGLRPFETGSVAKWPERFLEWIGDVCPPVSSKL